MKEENEKYLKEYEKEMITSLYYSYCRPLPTSVIREIESVLSKEDVDVPSVNYGCSTCILKLLSTAARFYFGEYPDRIPEKLRDRIKIRNK